MANFQVLINAIKFGEIANDGGVASTFAELGRVRKDTLNFNPQPPTKEKIFVEEQDSPVLSVTTAAATLTMSFSIVDWSPEILQALWGGTVVGDQWQEPAVLPTVEKSLRIEPRVGKPFIYPRCEITANIEYDTTGKIFQIAVSAEKLQPNKVGEPALMIGDQVTT
jgi:hypothetical protein